MKDILSGIKSTSVRRSWRKQAAKSSSCSKQSNMRNPRFVPKWNMCFAW